MNNTIYLSKGNKKLNPTKNVKYLVFNLPAIVTCPFATKACKACCYARKAERMYPSVLPCRERNFRASKSESFVADMITAIENELKKPSYQKAKQVVFRIHESGDFYSQEYADKWLLIIWHFRHVKKLRFMVYTKSVRYFRDMALTWKSLSNVAIRFSLWHDTKESELSIARELELPVYSAVESFTDVALPKVNQCRCKDCSTCRKCWDTTFNLYCEIH